MGYSIPAAIGAKFAAPERQGGAGCGGGAFFFAYTPLSHALPGVAALGCCFCAAVQPRAFLPVRHNFFTFARVR